MQSAKLIHVVAPGMPFDPQDLQKSMDLLKTWGYEFSHTKNLLNQKHPICASDRDNRWEFLQKALMHPEPSIIWSVRGGYGSLHLVPYLQKIKKPKVKKLFIGFSDNTTLHQYFNQQWHWPTWHGPHLDRFHKLSPTLISKTRKLLAGEVSEQVFKKIKPLNTAAQKVKFLESKIIGGNLITLQSSLATANAPRLKNRILFIEDIGERGYRVDRVLEHFSQAKVFNGVQAVILGPFVGGAEPDGRDLTQKVLREFSERQTFPVFSEIQSGHIPQSQILPFETQVQLKKHGPSYELKVNTGVLR